MRKIVFKNSTMLSSLIVIIAFAVIEQFVTDCYLPSFPAIAHAFHAPNSYVQLAVTLFALGTAISQFIFGPLSDSWGRKPVFQLGMVVFLIGTLISLFSPNIQIFLLGRLIQGLGMGSGYTIARAMARDMFSGKTFAKIISYLSMIIVVLPLASPIAGGYIQHHLGWRYVFLLLFLLGIILTLAIGFFLHETLAKENKQTLSFKKVIRAFYTLLTHRAFITNTVCASLITAIPVVYITITPFLYQKVLHLSPILFGWITASIAISAALGNFINAQVLRKLSLDATVNLGIMIVFASTLAMLSFALLDWLNLYVILFPMLFIAIGVMLISPNLVAKSVDPFPEIAGKAAALYGSIQTLFFALWSGIAAMFHTKNQWPLTLLLLILIFSVTFVRRFAVQESD